MPRFVKLGGSQVDLSRIVPDLRGVEDIVAEAVATDWQENRFLQFDQRLHPFPAAADMSEWDSFLLGRYPPLYMDRPEGCTDCSLGQCSLTHAAGRCGLKKESYWARLSLRKACRGCLSQMVDSREVLDYAIKLFGADKSVAMGKLQDTTDATSIGILTGQYVKTLADLDRALSYGEAQLAKLMLASYSSTGPPQHVEAMALHTGNILFLAMDVAERVKMTCFGFTNATLKELTDLINYPPVESQVGLGSVDRSKPVLAFVGDSFLAAWAAISRLKESGQLDNVEICGIGSVGHDIIRFYPQGKIVAPMTKAAKIIRSGLADVIVASAACLPQDILGEARRVDSRLIWTSAEGSDGLPDRTNDPIDDIVRDMLQGAPGAVIRDPEKAAQVAVKSVQGIRRKGGYVLSEGAVREQAARCAAECDRCFNVCPNSLLIGQGMRSVSSKGLDALNAVEEGCYFCGRCEEVCPERIPLRDIYVAVQEKRAAQDKAPMRPGRGPTPRCESASFAFGAMWGNSPGMTFLLGCGDSKYQGDIGWIANELVSRNCMVWTAGCGAGEMARHRDEATGQFLFEKFGAEAQPRNLINSGACSGCVHLMNLAYHYARTGTGISHYANYAETVDLVHNLWIPVMIMWGVLPDRMYAVANAMARCGVAVVAGPNSAFSWPRYAPGNRWDWQRWWTYLTFGGDKRITEPAPKHLIIPVETKEEAVTMAIPLLMRAADIRDTRQIRLETYLELHNRMFGDFPDDWRLFTRSDWELPLRYKARCLRELREKYGWEIDRMRVKKARHPDGRLLEMAQFNEQYSAMAKPVTKLARLIAKRLPVADSRNGEVRKK